MSPLLFLSVWSCASQQEAPAVMPPAPVLAAPLATPSTEDYSPDAYPGFSVGYNGREPFPKEDARQKLVVELARTLHSRDDAGLAAITASRVDYTYLSQCGEPGPENVKTKTVLEGDTKLTQFWTVIFGEDLPWEKCEDPKCDSLRVGDATRTWVVNADSILGCDAAGCCELANIGHNSYWIRRVCIRNQKVTAFLIEDGC